MLSSILLLGGVIQKAFRISGSPVTIAYIGSAKHIQSISFPRGFGVLPPQHYILSILQSRQPTTGLRALLTVSWPPSGTGQSSRLDLPDLDMRHSI